MRRLFCLLLPLGLAASALAELTPEQQKVPLEQVSSDPSAAKIVLIAGVPSNKPGQHEYFAGCALLHDWLKKVPGVAPVMVAEGWPKNEAVLDGARSVVIYMDGASKLSFLEPARWARMQSLVKSGAGLVMLHQGIDCPPEHVADFKAWFGAAFLGDIGCRGHWDVDFTTIPTHPINSGVKPFPLLKDGWLYNLHFADKGVTPLLQCAMPDSSRKTDDAKAHAGRAETVAWSYDRADGGRSFGFTGCDLHANWADANQRRLVLNGILWTAKLEVPAEGVSSEATPGQIAQNWDRKIFTAKTKKPAPGQPAANPGKDLNK